MSSGLQKNLNIEKEEIGSVLILLFQSVFLGIYAGAFDVSAQSYFLEVFSADLIPKAFAYSGAVGIVITSIYSYFQSRIRFSLFSVINLLFVAVVTLALRLGFLFFEKEALVFIMLVLMGPLTIISFLGFWGTVGRIYSLRQGKRLFGIIDTGQILGIILASYAIPILLSFKFEILNSLYICAGSIIIALLVQVFISSRYSLVIKSEDNPDQTKKKSNFFDLFKTKYTFLMVSFVVLSVLAAFFIHYSFLVVTETNFPESTALASFLGVFMGTVMVFSLLLKTFVYNKLMKTYGLKLALVLAPVILGIFVIGAILIGKFYGFTAASSGFTLFFLLIVSGKLFSKSLKDSVEVPSSKILYQSLDSNVRYDVQSRIDGTVNEIAALSAGLLLVSLAMVSTFNLMHFSYALAIILTLWILVAFLLHKSYKGSLSNALHKFKEIANTSDTMSLKEKVISKSDDSHNIENILEFAPQTWNGFISRNLKALLTGSDSLQSTTLQWISKLNISESQDLLVDIEKTVNTQSKSFYEKLIERFKRGDKSVSVEEISKLSQSKLTADRLKAVLAIGNSNDDHALSFLTQLLKDSESDVAILSIRLVGQKKLLNFTPVLIDMLDHKMYYPFAFNSLSYIVNDAIDRLDQAFYKTNASEKLMIRVIRLMSMAKAELAIPFLLTKLDQPLSKIHIECFKALEKLDYVPDPQFTQRLLEHLLKLTAVCAWNISIKQSIKDAAFSNELSEAFEEEIRKSYDNIFLTLSILYDAQTIAQIKTNFETGSGESIGYSLELLDIFVDESIKANLFSILEFSKETSKIHSLQAEYPVEILAGEKILHAILNRDYNYLNTYTLILAIKETAKLNDYQADNNLIAHLFNPNYRVAEMATIQLYLLDKKLLFSVMPRLEKHRRMKLEDSITRFEENKGASSKDEFEILQTSPLAKLISNPDLYHISGLYRRADLKKGVDFSLKILPGNEIIVYVPEGRLHISSDEKQVLLEPGEFFRLRMADFGGSGNILISPEQDSPVLILEGDDLRELIFDFEDVFLVVLESLLKNKDINALIKH